MDFLRYIQELIDIFLLKVLECKYSIFKAKILSYKALRNKKYDCFKEYPISNSFLFVKYRIDKIRKTYLFSAWIGPKHIQNREFLKFKEKDFEFLQSLVKKEIKKHQEYQIGLLNKNNYKELENLLLSNNKEEIQEFSIDFIYKLHPEKLFGLIDIIFTDNFSQYIKNYYKDIIKHLFNYTSYDDLTIYYNDLENTYKQDYQVQELKEELLKIIQEKNIFELSLKS